MDDYLPELYFCIDTVHRRKIGVSYLGRGRTDRTLQIERYPGPNGHLIGCDAGYANSDSCVCDHVGLAKE